MQCYTNANNTTVNSTTYLNAPAILNGDAADGYWFPWIATFRAKDDEQLVAVRNRSDCYMVGLKERIALESSSSVPWKWRRICFTSKHVPTEWQSGDSTFDWFKLTSSGYSRTVNNLASRTGMYTHLFQGALGIDWNNPLTAKVDTRRVTLKYDKTIILSSGSASGFVKHTSRWHPMRSNLLYNDDEYGVIENTQGLSTTSKAGMGDYYVVDFFMPRVGATSADKLLFHPQATLYWHEK